MISGKVYKDSETGNIASIDSLQSAISSGFQAATFTGPLAGEPMSGVVFVIQDLIFNSVDDNSMQISGQIISTVKEACRMAFLKWSSRLSFAMYSCDLQAPSDVLGKVYGVLTKRRGRILSEVMRDGTQYFSITSVLPVIESFGFSEDIRKKTSGAAVPQLVFLGFEIFDMDPFWVPGTAEELEDLGDKSDKENLALKYLDEIRTRKGFKTNKKIVEHGEKQKTMKNK